jgi:hypothetical protein
MLDPDSDSINHDPQHCLYNLYPTLQDMDEKELNKAMEMPAGLQNLGRNTYQLLLLVGLFALLIDNGSRCLKPN